MQLEQWGSHGDNRGGGRGDFNFDEFAMFPEKYSERSYRNQVAFVTKEEIA
ncbi:hypothetical protein PC116_g17244 [Phytophthora cactorum]|nr:hypothetical protein PC116_g17244 [Phytophthora cactorum]